MKERERYEEKRGKDIGRGGERLQGERRDVIIKRGEGGKKKNFKLKQRVRVTNLKFLRDCYC